MMLFQRRLLLELLRNAFSTLLLLTLVLLLIYCAAILQASEGLTLGGFFLSMPIYAAVQLDLTLPMAVLVAVVLTYGRAAADNEIDTLRASGVHPLHVLTPGLVFGGLMGCVLLLCMDYVKPLAKRERTRVAERGIDPAALMRNKLAAGEPVSLAENTILSAEDFDERGNALRMRVQILEDNGDLKTELVAESAELSLNRQTSEWELALRNFVSVKGQTMSGDEMIIRRAMSKDRRWVKREELTTPQLMAVQHRDPDMLMTYRRSDAALEVHMRLAAAASALVFVLLGLPTALLFRRNDRTGAFLIAFLMALFLYYPSTKVSAMLGESGAMSPLAASWSGNAALVLIALGLLFWVFRR
jgi:lipopolysaccharide export system permease protein